MRTVPEVGASTPATMLSSVVLPLPDGPTMATSTFPVTEMLTPPRACTWLGWVAVGGKILVRLSISTVAIV